MKRTEVTNEETFNQYLKQTRKLRLYDESIEDKSPLGLIEYVARMCPETTYSRGGKHCRSGKYRSLYDIVLLAKFYNPDITFKDIIFALFDYYKASRTELSYYLWYCPNIRRYNFRGKGYSSGVTDNTKRTIALTLATDYSGWRYEDILSVISSYQRVWRIE